MGSRVMHYCIASLIAERIVIDNKDHFILGCIAPDINKYMDISKDITHFVDRDEANKGSINYLRFVEKYRNRITEPFYLGYLCHLISDVVWSNDTYFKIVEFNSREERKEILKMCYRDFWRLNGKIINHYSLSLIPISLPSIGIDEINVEYMPELIEWIRRDFAFEADTAKEQLELFDNDNSQIIEYIEKSVDKSVEFIKSLTV